MTSQEALVQIADLQHLQQVAKTAPSNPFERLPAEVRVMIYEAHFQLDHPVRLTSDKMAFSSYKVDMHYKRCTHGEHDWITRLAHPTSSYTIPTFYCTSPFDNETIMILPDPSVLALLQVCKLFYREAASCFYELNQFSFRNPEHILDVIHCMDKGRCAEIRDITFRFGTKNAKNWIPEVAAAFPKLQVMRMLVDYDQLDIKLNKAKNLKSARGMPLLRKSFTNLTRLDIHGDDQVWDNDGQSDVDVNDRRAVGPWLRKHMVKKPKTREQVLAEQ